MASAFPSSADDDDNVRWAACIAEAVPLDIHTAASLGDDYVVQEALRSDPSQSTVRNDLGWSPLMFAVWQGHESVVMMLLEAARRCEVDATTDPMVGRLPRSGRSLFMVAARFGYLRIASTFCRTESLEMRDFRGQTVLFHAVRGGNEDLIRMLVDQGANVNAVDHQGQTVLWLAQRCRSPETYQFLKNAGAKLRETTVPRLLSSPRQPTEKQLSFHLTLASVLEGLSLQKYLTLFQLHHIDLPLFLTMTEDDLRHIGVSLLGPRRKMTLEIERLCSLFGLGDIPKFKIKTPH